MISESKLAILERFGDSDSQDMVREIRNLRYAIRMMCTEMPTHWNELAIEEGWGDVVAIVQEVIENGYWE